jgi:DNA-binding protein HU-beta
MSLTQAQLVAELSAKNEPLTKVQVKGLLDSLTALAYKEAKNGFPIPGLGKIVLMKRKARIGRNPATGESIKIPAKTVLKFRIAKAAKEAINGPAKKPAPAAKKAVKKVAKKK